MNNNNHRISPEADRRAYQVCRNITRLHNYHQQTERLERMKRNLAWQFMEHCQEYQAEHVILAIKAGHFALSAGNSYEQARSFADARLQELSNEQ